MSSARRDVTVAAILVGLGLIVGIVLYALVAPPAIDAAFDGASSWTWLNETVATRRAVDPAQRDLDYFHWIGRTVATKAALLWIVVVGAWPLVRHRHRVIRPARRFLNEREGPLNLAVARIAVFFTLLFFTDKVNLPLYAGLPSELQFPPTGLGPVLALLPSSEPSAHALVMIFKAVCVMAMFGLFTRWTTIATVVLALYVYGLPQMFGKVNHCHHLIWFGAVLCAAPCGDALSIDALIRRRRSGPAPAVSSRRYALPMRFIWLLFAVVYFFPGFWKIWMGGIDWIFSDHLKFQMYHLWSTHDSWRPLVDPSGSPLLCAAGAASTIIFEMGFVALMFHWRTRLVALALGLGFHVFAALTLNIAFGGLMWCYVVFIDWERLLARFRTAARTTDARPAGRAVTVVGLAMLIPALALGAAGNNNGWPFACYPRFSYPIFRPERSVIEFDVLRDGEVIAGDLDRVRGRFRTARWIGLVRNILIEPDPALRVERLRALCTLALDDPDQYESIRFYRATYSTIPDDRGAPPLRRELIETVSITPTPPESR